ncbi:phosphotransferase family protein [Streptoalloteichus hindustanus]|uniref:Phosphotransferase enzyme family protein n=1 Tax=Streptoalloteichus hindustanus TaxID=2017 RepID=A0A1M5I852_STRHI|nr:aminoglycoside phosphotransferase family protein [Streptoalloteichus hindustanus]SHG24110.1 Phosphotransferase enzyme family protein [Streptoalloteichus hindustanus]
MSHEHVLSAQPSPATLAWALRQTGGSRVLATEFLTGGVSHANHALVLDGPRPRQVVLRRWARPGWEESDPDFTVEREVAALTVLERAGFPAPRVLAADPEGRECDAPALLVTRLPGHGPDEDDEQSPRFLPQLAATAFALHRVAPPWPGVPDYRPYNDLSDPRPPATSTRPEVWERAFAMVSAPPPPGPVCLIHRDYHQGNTLWRNGQITGVVDWTTASRGCPDVDLGHMCWNLVVDYGEDRAEEFLRHYGALSGTEAHPYWLVRPVVDLLPDVELDEEDLDALEPYLARQLARG